MPDKQKDGQINSGDEIKPQLDFEILHYSIDKDGNWERGMTANWGAKEITNTQSWIAVKERMDAARDRILNHEESAIGYFMAKSIMNVKLLSQYIGFSKCKVKRHLKPKVFRKLKQDTLKRYAELFEVSVEEMVNLEANLKETLKTEDK